MATCEGTTLILFVTIFRSTTLTVLLSFSIIPSKNSLCRTALNTGRTSLGGGGGGGGEKGIRDTGIHVDI